MGWMKVDDQFHSSRKLNSIPKRFRFQAAGLWIIAGSWVAAQETDGFVPDYMIDAWNPSQKTVESLVSSGLWRRESSGFSFVSWLEFNVSREESEAERAAGRERKKKSRERKRREAAGHGVASENVTRDTPVTVTRDSRVPVTGVSQRPDPTRPDPTQKGGGVADSVTTARADVLPPSFSLVDPADARCAAHAGLPRDQVPACGACRDARLAAEQAAKAARRTAREAIAGCQWCDDTGHISRTVDGVAMVKKCDHQEFPRFDEPAPGGFTPASSPQARREVLKRFK